VDKEVVRLVCERAGNYCEVCGKSAELSMALHHRKLKSRGGKDSASNVVRIHHKCHNLGTKSIHLNPSMAEINGWMVGSWQDPEEAPFLRPDGTHVLLMNDGTIKELGKVKK
jgi:hypothetical protein